MSEKQELEQRLQETLSTLKSSMTVMLASVGAAHLVHIASTALPLYGSASLPYSLAFMAARGLAIVTALSSGGYSLTAITQALRLQYLKHRLASLEAARPKPFDFDLISGSWPMVVTEGDELSLI